MKKKQGTNSLPFGRILRSVMRERGFTVRAIAEMANVRSSVVQGWLEGANPHDLLAIERLSQALGLGFKQLLLGEGESPPTSSSGLSGFEEREFFDGLCQVTIRRLVPRRE